MAKPHRAASPAQEKGRVGGKAHPLHKEGGKKARRSGQKEQPELQRRSSLTGQPLRRPQGPKAKTQTRPWW